MARHQCIAGGGFFAEIRWYRMRRELLSRALVRGQGGRRGWHGRLANSRVQQDMSVLQRLLLRNFVVLFVVHQYEEYGWPGGEPAIMNVVLRSSSIPDRYPLNQNSAMVVNVLAAYGFYLVPVFFPSVIWLALAPRSVRSAPICRPRDRDQRVKLRSVYNPGLAAVALGHIPIGVYYLYYVHTPRIGERLGLGIRRRVHVRHPVQFFFVKMTYTWLARPKTHLLPVADEEMRRFNVPEKSKPPEPRCAPNPWDTRCPLWVKSCRDD